MKSFIDFLKNSAKLISKWKYLAGTKKGDWLYRDYPVPMRVLVCINDGKIIEISVSIDKYPLLASPLWSFDGFKPIEDFKKQFENVKKESYKQDTFRLKGQELDSKKFVNFLALAIKDIEELMKGF